MASKTTFAAIALIAAAASAATAGSIDFESVPGTTAADNLIIGSQYAASQGMSFGFDSDGDFKADGDALPFLEAVGTDGTDGFYSTANTSFDMARSDTSASLGNFFLRSHDLLTQRPGDLLVSFSGPKVTSFTGELWDIQGNSRGTVGWTAIAVDASGTVLDTDSSPIGITVDPALNPYESGPWNFELSGNGIAAVVFVASGTNTELDDMVINLDNLATVPTPASAGLLVAGGLIAARRRRA